MSSSVYSLGDSIYKKATQFYNDYIFTNERVQREKQILHEINHGEIIFSKNNVCIHLNDSFKFENYQSNSLIGACNNKNCLPGYFSIKLIKCQSNNQSNDQLNEISKNKLISKQKNQIEETSFIDEKQFEIDQSIKKVSSVNDLNKNDDLKINKQNSQTIEQNENSLKRNSSAHLKQIEMKEDQHLSSFNTISMVISWMPNLIFTEKSIENKLTRNLSIKSDSIERLANRKRCKSLSNLNDCNTNRNNLISARSYASDSQLNLVSNSYNRPESDENLLNENNFIFSININKVKSLKLFFGSQLNDDDPLDADQRTGKDGQLVVENYDLKYKIFHFHNCGLAKLEQFLLDWDFIFYLKQKNFSNTLLNLFETIYEEPFVVGDFNNSMLDFYLNKYIQLKNQKQFQREYNNANCIKLYTINLPALNYLDLQNEYSTYKPIAISSSLDYFQYFSTDGQLIYCFDKLKTRVFFSGVDKQSRSIFYPYLLNRFSSNLTTKQKNEIIKHGEFLYKGIDEKRRNIRKDDPFYRKFVQFKSTILVDLPRTDKSNKELELDKNRLKQMERILLNYTLYSRLIGYTQGFSDLLAPLIIILSNEPESEIFFNFVHLVEKKSFFCLPNDESIDSCMAKIRELLRILDSKLYDYLKQLGQQSFSLLFCHRWMLLCFRREFDLNSSLRVHEMCWCEPQFQLFIAVSIIQIYGHDLIEKQMNSDDILFYFSNLAQKMNADLVMKKARSQLFHFRSLNKIPCTLRSLCNAKYNQTNLSNWTTQLQPYFECVKSRSEPDVLLLCNCDYK